MIKAEIKEIEYDDQHNILVQTDYMDAETETLVQSGASRYTYWPGETEAELVARIKQDVDKHAQALISRAHFRKRNREAVGGLQRALVGHSVIHKNAPIQKGDKLITLLANGQEA